MIVLIIDDNKPAGLALSELLDERASFVIALASACST